MTHYASPFATVDLANDAPTFRFTETTTMSEDAAKLLRRIAAGDSPRTETAELRELATLGYVELCPAVKGAFQVTAKGSEAYR